MSRYWSSSDPLFVEMILKVGCVFVNATVRGILKPGSWTVDRTWKIGGQHVGVIVCTPSLFVSPMGHLLSLFVTFVPRPLHVFRHCTLH